MPRNGEDASAESLVDLVRDVDKSKRPLRKSLVSQSTRIILFRVIIYLTRPRFKAVNILIRGERYEPRTKSLQDAIGLLLESRQCISYLAAKRWPNGVICPIVALKKLARSILPARLGNALSIIPKREFSVKGRQSRRQIPLSVWINGLPRSGC